MAVTTAEREDLRDRYRPETVRVLFVHESPPKSGAFFYSGDSVLYEATRDAFHAAIPGSRSGDFRERFASLGCFLDDLSLEPISHWKSSDPKRIEARKASEPLLEARMRELTPVIVFIVVKDIEENVGRALEAAGLGDVPRVTLTFPWEERSRTAYVTELSGELRTLIKKGQLSPR